MKKLTDAKAMGRIQAKLDGQEWDADTLDAIADIVRATGRDVRDSDTHVHDDDCRSNGCPNGEGRR